MMLPAILLLSANLASGKPGQVIIYPVADIEGGSFMMSSPQLKFDISSIPSGAKIISAKLWLHVFYMMGGRNYYIMRVEDQDWDETITPIEFNSQAVTDVESFFSLYEGWGYVSVENQLIVDYSAGRTYASFRLSPVDSGWSTEAIVDRHVLCLAIGINEMNCYSSEYDGYDPYLEVNYYLPPVAVDISPSENSAPPGENVTFTVTVINTGDVTDNYDLTVSDDAVPSWIPSLSENLLGNVGPGENRMVTLSVTVPENATSFDQNNILVAATSVENEVTDSEVCIARVPGEAIFRLVNLFKISLDVDLYLGSGSKLVAKFYTWGGYYYRGENIVWSGTTPDNVSFSKIVPHPWGDAVENVRLDLTYDSTENVISTLDTFIVRKCDLRKRYLEIPMEWALTPTREEKDELRNEFRKLPLQWALAPPC